MDEHEQRAGKSGPVFMVPGTVLEWNRGDRWLPVTLIGPSRRREGWYEARHERMGWTTDAPAEDFRLPSACPACRRPL
jgi:hypothetical protein